MPETKPSAGGWAGTVVPNETERARLRAQSYVYDDNTVGHLESLGVHEGWRCLEVGAGEGSIARWLSARVGPSGSVVATDLDTRFLSFPPAGNVEVAKHDIVTDPRPGAPFDLIHARFVLCHIDARQRVLERVTGWLKPGGWLLVEDPFVVPELRGNPLASKFYTGLANLLAERLGSDYRWALTLPEPLRAAGLVQVGDALHVPAVPPAGAARAAMALATVTMRRLTLHQMRGELVRTGLLTEAEVGRLDTLLMDPDVVLYCGGSVSAWGQRR